MSIVVVVGYRNFVCHLINLMLILILHKYVLKIIINLKLNKNQLRWRKRVSMTYNLYL